MALTNWRTINIDLLDPESSANFDISTLHPAVVPVSSAEAQQTTNQIRQLLRGGDSEGALRGALDTAPYGADDKGKDIHLAAVIEILQSIRQSEMTPILNRIYKSDGGSEALDVLVKYIYKGMAHTTPSSKSAVTPQATGFSQIQGRGLGGGEGGSMSVLLSWHEKVVDVAGLGSVMRVMTDRRTV